jgi:hypothetical protein
VPSDSVDITIRAKDQASQTFGKLQTNTKSFAGKMKQSFSGIASAARVLVPIIGGIGGAFAVKEFVEKSNVQEEAIQRITALMKSQGHDYEELVPKIEAVTAAYQKKTTFGDEAQMDALAQMIGITGDVEKSLSALPTVLDLAAGAGMDLGTAAMYVGRSMEGQPEMLARYVPAIRNIEKEQRTWANVQDMLSERFGGSAEEMSKSGAGMLQQFENTMGDLKETFGDLIKTALTPFIEKLSELIEEFNTWLKENPEFSKSLEEIAGVFAEILVPVIEDAMQIFKALMDWFNGLTDKQQKIVGTLGAIGVALVAAFAITGPAGLAIAGVSALILGLKYLYDNNAGFRSAIDSIGAAFMAFIDKIKSDIEGVKTFIEALISIKDVDWGQAGAAIKDAFVGIWDSILEFWKDLPERAKQAAIDIINAWIDGIRAPIEAVKKAAGWLGAAVGKVLGQSLPTEGPLTHPETGSKSIVEAWAQGFIDNIDVAKSAADAITGAVGGVLDGLLDDMGFFGDIFTDIWHSITDQIVADIGKQIEAIGVLKTLTGGIGGIFSGIFGAIFGYAGGGIIPGGFKAFAGGGIATQPTLGLIGEGRYDEAVIPMPSGEVPVELRGGGGNVTVNISFPNIHDVESLYNMDQTKFQDTIARVIRDGVRRGVYSGMQVAV